jgi:hypothetical protein
MMIRSWSSKNPSRIDPAELERVATDSLDKVRKQQPRVNALTSYLERRKNQNGFGEDFEYTLRTKEA